MNINGIVNPRLEIFFDWLPVIALLAALACMLLAARAVRTWHEDHIALVLESGYEAESTSQQDRYSSYSMRSVHLQTVT